MKCEDSRTTNRRYPNSDCGLPGRLFGLWDCRKGGKAWLQKIIQNYFGIEHFGGTTRQIRRFTESLKRSRFFAGIAKVVS